MAADRKQFSSKALNPGSGWLGPHSGYSITMSNSFSDTYVTAEQLRGTSIAMITITSLFYIARSTARWYKVRHFQAEDVFLLLSWASFLGMSINYVVSIPAMYRFKPGESCKTPLHAPLRKDANLMIKMFFYNNMLLFTTLWSVKFSILFLYRRLMTGLTKHMRWWWAITTFCVLTLIGAIVSIFTSCSSMHAWFTAGLCDTPRDTRAQIASLYYAFAADVLSAIMIMVLPLGIIWNLQIRRAKKFGIGGIFCVAMMCIVVAMIRVVHVGVKSDNKRTPCSSWLALWGIVETGIAVIVGCLPSFAVLYPNAKNSRRGYNSSPYYEDRLAHADKIRQEGLQLSNLTGVSAGRSLGSHSVIVHSGNGSGRHSCARVAGTGQWVPDSSTEGLTNSGAIAVTSTIRVSSSEAEIGLALGGERECD